MAKILVPETVNLHITASCNQRCVYCFGRFPSLRCKTPETDWSEIIALLACSGVKRVNFSGGEPTLHPRLPEMLRVARGLELDTSIVTNGWALTDQIVELCDMVGLSIDSATDEGNARARRVGRSSYVEETVSAAERARAAGCFVKVNTVVTALNVCEDVSPLYRRIRPDKLKLLQFTAVKGENDAVASDLQVSREEFRAFVGRHLSLRAEGLDVWVQEETDTTIAASYVMVDPEGRVFQHAAGRGHLISPPILEVGFEAALLSVGGYDRDCYEARGGHVFVTGRAA